MGKAKATRVDFLERKVQAARDELLAQYEGVGPLHAAAVESMGPKGVSSLERLLDLAEGDEGRVRTWVAWALADSLVTTGRWVRLNSTESPEVP